MTSKTCHLNTFMIISIIYASISLANESHHTNSNQVDSSSNQTQNSSLDKTSTTKPNSFCGNMMTSMFSGMHDGMMSMPMVSGMHNEMMSMMHSGGTNMLGQHHISSIKPNILPDLTSDGAQAFSKNCAQCHGLPSPSAHTKEEWLSVIDPMTGYITAQNKPTIDADELQNITDYLTNSDSIKDEVIAMPSN